MRSRAIAGLGAMALLICLSGVTRTGLRGQSVAYTGAIDYGVTVADQEVVLFPFDHDAIPFRSGLQLSLQSGKRHGVEPVVPVGEPGQPDSRRVVLYGTVIPIGNELRMWYLCSGAAGKGSQGTSWRVCYATSTDGITWRKPKLGLVNFAGSTQNNRVALDPVHGDAIACAVIYDPEDPNTQKRFKMIYENRGGSDSAAYSPDGLTWTNAPGNPAIQPVIEPTGLIKYNGFYYLAGHGAFQKRVMVVDASPDFDHWTDAVAVAFRRDNFGPFQPYFPGGRSGEQVHLGAGLWNRDNVILGLYGQWHGPGRDSDDRRDMRMDIGFIISHDALHYYEPIPGFKMIAGRDQEFTRGDFRARLAQGQALVNVGEQTFAYYSFWGTGGADGIYLVAWDRDRLGYFSVPWAPEEGQAPTPGVAPQFITCPIRLNKPQARVYLNAEGLGPYTQVTVEVLDDKFREIPGFSGSDSVPVMKSGLREEIKWRNKEFLSKLDHPVRIRVRFGGIQIERARVYAVYLDSGGSKRH